MNEFIGSLMEGLAAAKQIEKNKEEIKTTLQNLTEDLLTATSQKVLLSLTEDTSERGEVYRSLNGRPRYRITITNPTTEETVKKYLAIWNEDRLNGYPCTMERASQKWICSSPEEIVGAFSDLVRDPHVALAILELINLTEQ